jgi:hypothetical protein
VSTSNLKCVERLGIRKSNRLTVAGQQMRTSYLLPSSSPRRRYQDSRPRGTESVGNCTGSCVGRMVSEGDRTWRRRWSKLGWTLERVTGRGPRNIVFSTLAFTVQSCVTTTSRVARARIFGGRQVVAEVRVKVKGHNSFSHVGQSSSIGQGSRV